jgi:hypothetical protein
MKNPVALVLEGFLAGALLFAGLNHGMLKHDAARADAQAAATVQSLIG